MDRRQNKPQSRDYGANLFQFQVYNFLSEKAKARIDFHFAVVNDLLTFVSKKDRYTAGYEITVIISKNKREIVEFKTASNALSVENFELTNSRLNPHRHTISFHLLPGKYDYEIQVWDDESKLILNRKNDLLVRDFTPSAIHTSDIIFADKFEKSIGAYDFTPNLNNVFNDIKSSFSAYFEVYPPEHSDSVTVTIKIFDKHNKNIFNNVQKFTNTKTIPVVVHFKDHIQKPGEYFLHVHSTDGKRSATVRRKFNVHWANIPLRETNIDVAINQLRLITKKDIVTNILDAPQEDKKKLFDEFWEQRDPTPGTPRNELREEFFIRIDFSNKNFSEVASNRAGWETDRGKIFVKNGPPDEIERNATEINMPTAEIWLYAKLSKKYIFSDRSGNGIYRLVKED
jgi:GWxTD domain-containing protein